MNPTADVPDVAPVVLALRGRLEPDEIAALNIRHADVALGAIRTGYPLPRLIMLAAGPARLAFKLWFKWRWTHRGGGRNRRALLLDTDGKRLAVERIEAILAEEQQ